MILSDRSLREAIAAGRLVIDPLDDDAIQPSSIDVRLDNHFRVFYTARHPYIDVKQPMEDLTELVEVKPDDAFILHPGEFVLGSTLEQVGIPPDLAARLEGKSSLGRLGLMTHSTAGFLDPGFTGHVTLELSNVANLPITLYPGMRIGQIAVFQLTTAAERPHGSRGSGRNTRDSGGRPRPVLGELPLALTPAPGPYGDCRLSSCQHHPSGRRPKAVAPPAEVVTPVEEGAETGRQRMRRLAGGAAQAEPVVLLVFCGLAMWMFAPAWSSRRWDPRGQRRRPGHLHGSCAGCRSPWHGLFAVTHHLNYPDGVNLM